MAVMGEGIFPFTAARVVPGRGPFVWADLFVLFSGQLSGLTLQDASHAVLG
jgi:hypothetical protein